MALIEVTLFDHNLLNKRNAHTALLKALMAWDMIDQLSDEELKKTTNGMANKLGFLPSAGYMEWNDKSYVNDKKTCMDIGKDLGSTMPYSRKKEEESVSFFSFQNLILSHSFSFLSFSLNERLFLYIHLLVAMGNTF